MRKWFFNLVFLGFAYVGWSQADSNELLSVTGSFEFIGVADNYYYFVENDDSEISWEAVFGHENKPLHIMVMRGRARENCQIRKAGLVVRYSDLMNIYKGRSLQLVKDIDSDRLFWSPMQSVLNKPFENTVFS
jgi:hypothetical protein